MKIRLGKMNLGFTMIEIAISLGIIAFALVAIIGILPTGLTTQRDSKEDTWILQDAGFLGDCIKHSLKGNYALSNYIDYVQIVNSAGITNTVSNYNGTINPDILLGLLGTPKYEPDGSTNKVTARIRGLTGNSSDQTNLAELSFSYLLTVEITPHVENLSTSIAYGNDEYSTRTNLLHQLTNNLHELRMAFNWPILPKGDFGNGSYVYRSLIPSPYISTNVTLPNGNPGKLYYFKDTFFDKNP
ncbi:MAG: hypothetical protein JWM04_2063 [Verrucomicrobiales bacterium]|nr:hypothetical protein [Verrucomicrobiales bacterium]